ncbi:unnamed protein product [Heligmosomoides polygyrus]|uniref:CCHC-type domain-containing protein n=1 Tax=Heligmosomoides polygyrus TaxID=6339 RepID=A0A183GCA3_HELPZ|nr:unnamed protein product [Heligmosomoides polygyrus]
MQLKQLQRSGPSGSELRETWFRISGILHGLRKFEDFKMVLPILDLVKGKFPQEIQTKLHDFEFQKGEDFDLDAIMRHLDNIIASKEKYEDSTMLNEDYAVNVSIPQRGRTTTPSPRRHDTNICHFCDSPEHETAQCYVKIPLFIRRRRVRALALCYICLRQGHAATTCERRPCQYCGTQHHERLCENRKRRSRTPHSRDSSRSQEERHPRYYRFRSPSRDRYP